jgi:hypothetical protein
VAACEPPRPAVICHNGNCAAPTDPARDDTLGALRESLALTYQGRPLLDGVELDSLWRGADDVCLFAHDLATITEDVPATAPAEELATYFARPGPIGWRDDAPFEVLLELKSGTAIDPTVRHTPAQLAGHAACAWDIYEIVAAAAVANDRDVRVTMSAFAPELLAAVLAADADHAAGAAALRGAAGPAGAARHRDPARWPTTTACRSSWWSCTTSGSPTPRPTPSTPSAPTCRCSCSTPPSRRSPPSASTAPSPWSPARPSWCGAGSSGRGGAAALGRPRAAVGRSDGPRCDVP